MSYQDKNSELIKTELANQKAEFVDIQKVIQTAQLKLALLLIESSNDEDLREAAKHLCECSKSVSDYYIRKLAE
ncbi:hypothetical protein [Sphaerothrix gracilis]|uniref:hypothetical protein n=1 Tax=Sphaerothrix gracilis TaxID=3151835 RepID=UPI0031FD7A7A